MNTLEYKRTEQVLSFDDAKFFAFAMGDGWRLPTMRELQELDHDMYDKNDYWTSNIVKDDDDEKHHCIYAPYNIINYAVCLDTPVKAGSHCTVMLVRENPKLQLAA
jgi:hypothetical protein